MSRRPHVYGMLPAAECSPEVGDILVAKMNAPDADLYYEQDTEQGLEPKLAGRIAGVIETFAVKRLCDAGKPRFRVVAEPKASTLYTIELVI